MAYGALRLLDTTVVKRPCAVIAHLTQPKRTGTITYVPRRRRGVCASKSPAESKILIRGVRRPKQIQQLPRCQAIGSDASSSPIPARSSFAALSATLTNYFPIWVAIACLVAVVYPPSFLWFRKDYVTAGLALTMLAMGTTLTLEDFTNVASAPGKVMLGAVLQYTIMPLMGLLVSRLAGLPEPFAIGICLVASCPGGSASNIVTFLANADVALSVMMTTVSTVAAVVMTPLLVKALVGALVPVDPKGLFLSTIQVVLAPVIVGAALNTSLSRAVKKTAPFAPLVAVAVVVLIVASVIAQNAAAVTMAGPKLIAAIVALHTGGFALGYGISRAAGLPERAARTNSIEVGMQNSAFGAVLAAVHFEPATAVPCALSACLHSLMGSALAAAWRASDNASADAASSSAASGSSSVSFSPGSS